MKAILVLLFVIGCSGGRSDKVEMTGKKGEQGEQGEAGETGKQGEAGKFPSCAMSDVPGGTRLDCEGIPGFTIMNGANGTNGEKGDTGDRGENGEPGIPGAKGDPGNNGTNGVDGKDCKIEKGDNGSLIITCGETTGTIPGERKITICIRVGNKYETRHYPVTQFIAEIYGKYMYMVGKCGEVCK